MKIVLNREKYIESLSKSVGIFEKKPMQQKDWILFLNNCYMKQKKLELRDKKATYLLRSIITEGIPIELRSYAYIIFSGAFLHFSGNEKKIDFFKLKEGATDEVIDQIDKDIVRVHLPYNFTILANKELYKKKHVGKTEEIDRRIKEKATNILRAYSVYDPHVGYVQGMASIAVAIIYNFFISKWVFERREISKEICFELSYSEEEAFFVFLGVIENLNVRKFFLEKFASLKSRILSFENVLKMRHPKILDKLTDNGVRKFSF